ncbi:hypothetical protein UPYG_G00222990 [Umbra pygmaea]|uniref:Endonuclease/exonuclease/phosphatase domain-containing protein n=1 Tax=Umbra pygmaea TaxID=75934 RepID=A0ABD0WBX0_UMBPY
MIGSLLFYGLYPLTRLLNRISESLKKCPSMVFFNGKVWDGGVPSRRFTTTQTALLDQWLSTGTVPPETKEPGREMGEALKENDTLGKETSKEAEMRKTIEEPESETAKKESGCVALGQKAEEAEMRFGKNSEEREVLKEDWIKGEVPQKQDLVQPLPQSEWTRENNPFEDSEDAAPKRTSDDSEVQKPTVNDGTIEDGSEDRMSVIVQQLEKNTSLGKSVTKAQVQHTVWENRAKGGEAAGLWLANTGEDPAEIWDPGLDLVYLLHEAQTQPKGWHFPIGPGLEEVVFCPSTSIPGMSYNPQSLERGEFEVVWRLWENLSENPTPQEACLELQGLFDFTVMSYNILAQDLLEANQELYTHCPLEVLSWDYRFPNLIREFKKWEPDILCLQEVQEDHFKDQLHPALSDMGYTCVYKRRTRNKRDGCVICYRSDRFSQMSESLVEFYRPDCEVLDRDNVGIVLLLQPIVTQGSEVTFKSPPLCVATTHLLFNPKRGDIKLAQLAVLLAEIDCVVNNCKVNGEPCNVVLCGDFNALPNMPLYQLITTRQLYYHGLPAWMISGQEDLSYKAHHWKVFAPLLPSTVGINDNCQYTSGIGPTCKETVSTQRPKTGRLQYDRDFLLQLQFCEAACVRPCHLVYIPGVTDNTIDPSEQHPFVRRFRRMISHNMNLQSVYIHVIPETNRSKVTTLHSEGGAVVDYIFYTPQQSRCSGDGGGLKLLGRLALLSEEDLWSMTGLPNDIFPSDHLSLLAKFQMYLNPV